MPDRYRKERCLLLEYYDYYFEVPTNCSNEFGLVGYGSQ